ncbi:hypothetical protein [Zobellia sp. B3R18]|uniref:hypothetical protein n=1 Tax=Zobellia sp. B3R18 TaxID=2841568 RepID=UPI001C06655A|nr:hypothetical protein [Zobellia sp. B3R18]MBU2974746.1 hypothetical protein [Zobellia sp. B3R18]
MRVFLPLVCCLFFCLESLSQEKQLAIVNSVSGKEITIEESRRIKVITKTGEKFAGRFTVLNQNSIIVDDIIVSLQEIDIIRRHALFHTIMIHVNFLHIGSIMFLVGLAVGTVPSVFIGAAALTAGIYGVVKSPNVSKGYKRAGKWSYKIRTVQSP